MSTTRTFTQQDQLAFAELSGDYNPIHVDPLAARRTMFGRPVVHGIHAVMWAIDRVLSQAPGAAHFSIDSLTVNFRNPIIVGEPVDLVVKPGHGRTVRADIIANGGKLLSLSLVLKEGAGAPTTAVLPSLPEKSPCRTRTAAEVECVTGRLPLHLNIKAAARWFPHLAARLRADQSAALLASTRLVGMEAPGLHSLYVGLRLAASADATEPAFVYESAGYDERFSMLTLNVRSSGLAGQVTAVLRPPPQAQPGMADLKRLVTLGEFAGQRALVIGGSRGLGEVVAKLLAAGGAEVRLTYRSGREDAERVVADIATNGGSAMAFQFDATNPPRRVRRYSDDPDSSGASKEQESRSSGVPSEPGVASNATDFARHLGSYEPTLLAYMATPFIFSATPGQFSPALFRAFCDCYVDGFLATFQAIRQRNPNLTRVFYPSSSAVEQTPANMGEYAAAKRAAESLCQYLESVHRKLRIHTPRLPRLATDQTASLLQAEMPDAAELMLEHLRQTLLSEEE